MSEQQTLIQALVAAQAEIAPVGKDGRNQYHNYAYASAEAMLTAGKAALNAHGLALSAMSHRVLRAPTRAHEPNVPMERDVLRTRYTLFHVSGESLRFVSDMPIVPEKGRPEDKAVATAKTNDLSYTLRGLLCIPRVEEGTDMNERDDSKYTPPERRGAPPSAPKRSNRPSPGEPARKVVTQEEERKRLTAAVALFGGWERACEALKRNPADKPQPESYGTLVAALLAIHERRVAEGQHTTRALGDILEMLHERVVLAYQHEANGNARALTAAGLDPDGVWPRDAHLRWGAYKRALVEAGAWTTEDELTDPARLRIVPEAQGQQVVKQARAAQRDVGDGPKGAA